MFLERVDESRMLIAFGTGIKQTCTMKKRVLLVENDQSLAKLLKQVVDSKQHDCFVTDSLTQAYDLVTQVKPDVIVLDRLLPDGDGLELAAYIQDSYFTTRVLFISSLVTSSERIAGLETGADDYLPKPFSLKEFELKLERLLFREKVLNQEKLIVGSVTLFPHSGVALCGQQAVQLRRREAQILTCLFRHKNQVVSRPALISYVWSAEPEQPLTTTLDVYMRRIRKKLGDHGKIIQTARSFGYRAAI